MAQNTREEEAIQRESRDGEAEAKNDLLRRNT